MAEIFQLHCKNSTLNLGDRTHIMGILNVTPDSFSDGGKFLSFDSALSQGLRLADEGADILDIGGESTRPGAVPVSCEVEMERIIPVIQALSKKISIPISVDTTKSKVAEKALEEGAQIVNDISAGRFDKNMIDLVSKSNVPIIIMHMRGTPLTMQQNVYYEDVVLEIISFLKSRIQDLEKSGIDPCKIIIDPGIGFGKRLEDNLKIIANLDEFKSLGKPILIGVSRKSFIGHILNTEVTDRLEGTSAAHAVSILHGANIIRAHDVKEAKRVALVTDAIKSYLVKKN